jgi:DNA-binding response OmpR family regulator
MTISVLVVEDEAPIRMGLCDVLTFHGMGVLEANNGIDGLRVAMEAGPSLVLLDVMMPGIDGFEVCRRLRGSGATMPVLMLTAKGSEEDILRGFDAGADDYVTKPFSVAQLMARVQALLRRAGRAAPQTFMVAGIDIDADNLRANANGASAELSARDVELLAYLHANRERAVSREELLREVWGFARVAHVETRCVDMHIVKLRRKLADVGGDALIETVRGRGYRCG